jgi:hypothetical protein
MLLECTVAGTSDQAMVIHSPALLPCAALPILGQPHLAFISRYSPDGGSPDTNTSIARPELSPVTTVILYVRLTGHSPNEKRYNDVCGSGSKHDKATCAKDGANPFCCGNKRGLRPSSRHGHSPAMTSSKAKAPLNAISTIAPTGIEYGPQSQT